MKRPQPHSPVVALAVSAIVAVAIVGQVDGMPRGGSEPAASEAAMTVAGRRTCRLGTRFSTYHRKCVLWLPFTA